MLLALATVAAFVPFSSSGSLRGPRSLLQSEYGLMALWLPVLCGLLVAPWLTMLSRNPIAGTVFTVTGPGLLFISGELIGMAVHGRFAPEVEGFRLTFFRTATLGLCAIGAVMGWRTFMRLEAIDGRDADVRLPAWLRRRRGGAQDRASANTSPPVWLLIKKELHLQQISYVVASLYVLGWLGMVSWSQPGTQSIDIGTLIYAFLMALLVGSVASAEERRLGTLEWQVMLPVATAKQWIIKVAVALSLTMVMALGLPVLVTSINQALQMNVRTSLDILQPSLAGTMVLVTVGALYVSSLCPNGIQALLISMAATPAVLLSIQTVLIPAARQSFVWASRLSGENPAVQVRALEFQALSLAGLLPMAGVLTVMLRFALVNHRSAERGAGRLVKQVIWIAACLAIAVALWAALAGAVRW